MRKWLTLATAIFLIAAIGAGCAGSNDKTQETAEVVRGDLITSVSVSGNLEMPHRVGLSFGVPGVVAEILVNEGDNVVAGQILARIDTRSLELNVKMAQAQYEMAEYKLMQTIYPRYANTYLTDLPGVWLALESAQGNLEEAQNLLSEGKFEEVQAALEQIEASLHKAQEKSAARRWAVPFSIKLVEMETDEARVTLYLAREELNKAIIIAPFDGVVTDIDMKTDERISAAAQVISVVDPMNIEMDGTIDEIDISRVELEQEAIITLDALPDKDIKGKVTFISRAGVVQSGVVSYKTIIDIENPDEELRDGMSATAEIIIERYNNVLLIPNRAIRGTWDKPSVEVVVDGQIEQREISLGSSDGMKSEVLSGLEEGEMVVFPESQLPFRMFGG